MREHAGVDEGPGQKSDGIILGPQDGHSPMGPGRGHQAALERRQQCRPHQRGLAAARRAYHGQEPPTGEAPYELVALLVAAEEEVGLVLHERPQAGEGIGAPGAHAEAPESCATKGRRAVGSKARSSRITATSRVRKLSLAGSGRSATYSASAL